VIRFWGNLMQSRLNNAPNMIKHIVFVKPATSELPNNEPPLFATTPTPGPSIRRCDLKRPRGVIRGRSSVIDGDLCKNRGNRKT